jgi:hypothetical protein
MMMLTLIAILMPFSKGCMPYLKKARPARTPPAMSKSDMRTQTTPTPAGQAPAHRLFAQARQPGLMRLSGRS